MSRRKLAEGDMLWDAGEISEHIYFPRSGMIAIRVPTRDGTGVEVATVGHEGAAGFQYHSRCRHRTGTLRALQYNYLLPERGILGRKLTL